MSVPKKARTEHPPEVQKFVEFLKIRTVHPEPAYKESRLWLLDYFADIGLEVRFIWYITVFCDLVQNLSL